MKNSKLILWMFLCTVIFPAGLAAQRDLSFPPGPPGGATQDKPFPPYKVLGNLHYVGTDTQASFLVVTPAGNILLNSNFERNVPWLKDSVEKLGFKFTDTKILLSSHAHTDHMEADAMVKQMTGATVMVMDRDVPAAMAMMPGGKPHPIDRVLHHLERVSLGGTTMIAHLTPGHTEGDITWTLQVTDAGKTYDVVIPGAIAPGAGTHLADSTTYPGILYDSLLFYKYLRILPCDVMLGSHTSFYFMQEKYAKLVKGQNAFIDKKECSTLIDEWETLFNGRVEADAKRIASGKK